MAERAAHNVDPFHDDVARLINRGAIPYLPDAEHRSFERELSEAEARELLAGELEAWLTHWAKRIAEMSRNPSYNVTLAAEQRRAEAKAKAEAEAKERARLERNGRKAARAEFGWATARKIQQLEWYTLAEIEGRIYAILDSKTEATLKAAREAGLAVEATAQRVNGFQIVKEVRRQFGNYDLEDVDPTEKTWRAIAKAKAKAAEQRREREREQAEATRRQREEERIYGVAVSNLPDD